MTITSKNDFSINRRFAADAVSEHRIPSNLALPTDSIRGWQLPRTDPTGLPASIGAMNLGDLSLGSLRLFNCMKSWKGVSPEGVSDD